MNQNKFFANPATFKGQENRCNCPDCDEPLYFALKDKHHSFSLPLSTLLECLKFAENEGAIPPIDVTWWCEISNRFKRSNPLKENIT